MGHVPAVGGPRTLDSANRVLSRRLLQMRFNVTAQVSMANSFQEISATREVAYAR
jgi:hypothetical protein